MLRKNSDRFRTLVHRNLKRFSLAKLEHLYHPSLHPSRRMNMVILHGILGSAKNFRSIVKNHMISEWVNCYLVDLRNHGNSEHMDTMSFEEMAEDVMNFVKHVGIERNFLLMGHSLGARVAMELAGRYPDMPKAVIAIDLSPYNYVADWRFGAIDRMYEQLVKLSAVDLHRSMEAIRADVYSITSTKEEGDLILASIKPEEENKYKWRFYIQGILKNYYKVMESLEYTHSQKYNGPVKVICGKNSELMTPDLIPYFNQAFGSFNVEKDVAWIEGANHWVHFTQPKQFLVEVSQFLQTVCKCTKLAPENLENQ